jgi:hypothetical protein
VAENTGAIGLFHRLSQKCFDFAAGDSASPGLAGKPDLDTRSAA